MYAEVHVNSTVGSTQAADWGIGIGRGEILGAAEAFLNLPVELRPMVVVAAERGVDLREGKMRMLVVRFLGVPAVSEMVEHHLGDLHVRVEYSGVHPRIDANKRESKAPSPIVDQFPMFHSRAFACIRG